MSRLAKPAPTCVIEQGVLADAVDGHPVERRVLAGLVGTVREAHLATRVEVAALGPLLLLRSSSADFVVDASGSSVELVDSIGAVFGIAGITGGSGFAGVSSAVAPTVDIITAVSASADLVVMAFPRIPTRRDLHAVLPEDPP